MKTLHNVANKKTADHIDHSEKTTVRPFRRIVSILLCLGMMIPMLCNFGVLVLSSAGAEPTDQVMNRIADPNTMDDYLTQLLSSKWGSRYAGRVWTDKTVFAYGENGNQIVLDMATDGYDGQVGYNADFAHVFSALASSQIVNEFPPSPIDLVIVFDMSASMGQDTRYNIDTGGNYFVSHASGGDSIEWPAEGVLMSDRIENSRIQLTLDAINSTIDKLMEQNPENRVSVCCYGANATVILPLAHYKHQTTRDGEEIPYLKVGGMETLYYPGDLVWREADTSVEQAGWYWINNRDTCYTVVANALKNEDVSDCSMKTLSDINNYEEHRTIISNNVKNDGVKAFPGVANPADIDKAPNTIKENSKNINEKSPTGGYAARSEELKTAVKETKELEADDYVGYFTNTQGGIYLAYKQLADSEATTYTDKLSNGKSNTVARIPAAIIMSDGGANFAFNEMGETVDDWNSRFGAKRKDSAENPEELDDYYISDNSWDAYYPDTDIQANGRDTDADHRLGAGVDGREGNPGNIGDEWYNVYLPGNDTLKQSPGKYTTSDGKWDGLHTLYNLGADYYHDGTLQTPPVWDRPGVFYANDNDWQGTPATILEVLLTASYMNQVAKKHYETGWDAKNASTDSKVPMSTYTMNVDTENVPQWGRWRLFPTLDPKNYPPDGLLEKVDADPERFANQYGSKDYGGGDLAQNNLDGSYGDSTIRQLVFGAIEREWEALKNNHVTNDYAPLAGGASAAANGIAAKLDMTKGSFTYTSGESTISVTADEILNNIAYNNDFFDVESDDMDVSFEKILSEISGSVFNPISGENGAGVSNSITYQDPLGEYMEIKNQAINATVHDADSAQDYDMSLLVFGKMHGLVRAGVYDYQWNDKYMSVKHDDNPEVGTHGETPFPTGWYYGNDPLTAKKAPETATNDSGSYPMQSLDGKKTYKSAEEAWADGWVMRFDFKTLLQFVPIADAPADGLPKNLSDQVKNTVYTCYRFAGSQDDRNALHMNPIYGSESDIPKDLQEKWAKCAEEGKYPDTSADYANIPGVYRLSDIRVWVEDTGDFIDTLGAIAPNSGYDRSLYLNIPAAAVPTQLATITLDENGVRSYQTNLATDKGIDYETVKDATDAEADAENYAKKQEYEAYAAQSTPLRLFYAVGLEEELILRDAAGNQNGVDFTKISPEYITSHTVEGQDYVWFISNYFSNTTYDDYVTGADQTSRGDPTMTFSPSVENRYYIFQKSLPLYAHAYRENKNGKLEPVDNATDKYWREWPEGDVGEGEWKWNSEYPNGGGNGKTTWETVDGVQQRPGSWVGGEYMGTYKDGGSFEEKKKAALEMEPDENGYQYITDDHGTTYVYLEDGIVFLEDDAMNHVTSTESGGYTEDSISFSSDDYFFILVEYYVPEEGTVGKDADGNEIPGSTGGRMVQRVVARKGSEFGSAFVSDDINNGDMLCWVSMDQGIDVQFDYLSMSATGDLTRGEPTFEKLTYSEDELRKYLTEKCGIKEDTMMPNPDYNPDDPDSTATVSVLDYQVEYWTEMQQNAQIKAAIAEAKEKASEAGHELSSDNFNDYLQFVVATKPGGIRSGNMANNVHAKSENKTGTAQNYYVPVVSDNSGIGDGAILNNYMGNNGYLEIANQMLHVTKMLEAPEGFTLTEEAKNEEFNYQIYVQGVSGTRNAILTEYNEYGKVWERELAYIDVLTDNSELVLDNNSRRAVFISDTINGSLTTPVQTAKMVVENGTDEDGKPVYYEANEDGSLPMTEDGTVDESKRVKDDAEFYYLYLPSNGNDMSAQHTRRLYQNKDYDGTADGYPGTYKEDQSSYDTMFRPNGVTTFVNEGDHAITGTTPGAENRDSYRPANDTRPAGCRTYWAQDAELIPVTEVQAAEATNDILESDPGISAYAIEAVTSGMWTHEKLEDGTDCTEAGHINLTYYNLVIRRPEGETSMTAFESPLLTRSAYMTVTLEFGKNANLTDGSTDPTGTMTAADLYDQIIPSADRPDLFGTVKDSDGTEKQIDNAYIAAHTAEFTLKHGEGLLLSGLNNRITYRFTEKLTAVQMAQGYTLKRISHIQQRGSEVTYLPGVQKIPIYTKEGSTYGEEYGTQAKDKPIENNLTWAWDSEGTSNEGATMTEEQYAHTNAIIWECYATMAAGSSGNHHQPADVVAEKEANTQVWKGEGSPNQYEGTGQEHEVKKNPSCNSAASEAELSKTACDLPQTDGTTLHYMYYKGELIDPHYEGEASTFLRNMARYGVSPTVHFGVNGEGDGNTTQVPSTLLQSQTSKDTEYYDYNGVYSIYGNTGWFEEQANYVNTIDPEMLVVTKEVVDKNGEHVDASPDMTFSYTLKLTATDPAAGETGTADTVPALTGYDTVYLWKGNKTDMTGGRKWTDESDPADPKEYTMPETAPNLDAYQEFLPTAESTPADGKRYLQPLTLTASEDGSLTCTFELKADEAAVFYGIPAGTNYTVTETENPNYPISETHKAGDPYTDVGQYTQTGEVLHYRAETIEGGNTGNRAAMRPSQTDNRKNYYNQMSTGTLTVEKYIHDDDRWTVDKSFEFTVTLTADGEKTLSSDKLTVTKFMKAADGSETSEPLDVTWTEVKDAEGRVTSLTAVISLKHGERFVIGGIPLDTQYTVTETGRNGYNLEYVTETRPEDPEEPKSFIHPTDYRTSGTVSEEQAQGYWLFVNAKPPVLPFTGGEGIGAGMICAIGAVLLLASASIFLFCRRKRGVRGR